MDGVAEFCQRNILWFHSPLVISLTRGFIMLCTREERGYHEYEVTEICFTCFFRCM